eukprot:symbB.v1.2.030505.t1/scaffold3441.1/size58410/4
MLQLMWCLDLLQEPSGPTEPVGEEAARKAAEEEAAKKAAEEAADKAAEEEAARKAAEEEAVGETAESVERTEGSAEAAEVVREELRIEPRGPPYPKATDSSGREFSYQVIVTRRITGKKRPERPTEPKEPPKPIEKGKGKKGKGKNPNWRPRSEEGTRYRRVKGLLKLLDKRGGSVEGLPEHLQELIHSFGPGGPSSGSGVVRPAAKPRPVERPAAPAPKGEAFEYVRVEEEEPKPHWSTLSDIPEPDPAVGDQRKVTTGRLQEPEKEREEGPGLAGEPIRLRSRSRVRRRNITVHPRVTDLARSRADRLGGDPERVLGSNYRRRRAAAAEAASQSRARGTVRESIIQGVYKLDDQTQACSSCDERQEKAKKAVREYASRVVERSRTKPGDKKPVFVTETAPQLTRPKKRPAASKETQAEAKRKATEERRRRRRQSEDVPVIREGEQRGLSLEREIRIEYEEYRRQRAAREELRRAEAAREVLPEERREKTEEKKEEKKEELKEEKAEVASAAAAEGSEYSYTYETLSEPTTSEEEVEEGPTRD